MSVMYATVTSKGQITLPSGLRRAFDIKPGQTVGFRIDGDHVVMEPPVNVESVRDVLEQAARRRGTWGTVVNPSDVWRDESVRRHGGA